MKKYKKMIFIMLVIMILFSGLIHREVINNVKAEEIKFETDFSLEQDINLFEYIPDFENHFRIPQLEGYVDLCPETVDFVLEIKNIGPLLDNPRRPRTYALVEDYNWKEAKIEVEFRFFDSEGVPDVVIPLAYQDPNNWYYVHISETSDQVHNVIMKVEGTGRRTIHTERNRAPLKTKDYYKAEIYINTETGEIRVYVNDDKEEPILVGKDKQMEPGLVGVGSFDTYVYFKQLKIEGEIIN